MEVNVKQEIQEWFLDSGFHSSASTRVPSISSDQTDFSTRKSALPDDLNEGCIKSGKLLLGPEEILDCNAKALANLINCNDERDMTSFVLPELTRLLTTDDSKMLEQSARIIMELSRNKYSRDILLQDDQLIRTLVNLLKTIHDVNVVSSCASALLNFSYYQDGLSAILQFSGVPCLCKLLCCTTDLIKFLAISTTHNLLMHQEGAKEAMRLAGGIEILTSMLSCDNARVLAICTDCLQLLSFGHKESKLVILENGGPVELIRIIQTYTYEKLLYTTARLLKVLSVCPHNKLKLVQSGCVQVLGLHLVSTSDRFIYNCLWTLRNLSDIAYKCDGLESLLQVLCQLLSARKVNMIECAVGILSNLLCTNQKNKMAMCEMGGVECLVRCLSDAGGRDSIAEMAICALCHLTNRYPNAEAAQATILAIGGLPAIMKLMQPTGNWSLIKAAVGLIRNLAFCPSNTIPLRDCGAFQRVVQIFVQVFRDMQLQVAYGKTKVEDLMESSIVALQVLCRDAQNCSLLVSQNVTSMFVQLLHANNENIQRAAASVLAEIARDKDGLDEILTGGASRALSQLSLSHNEGVATSAAIVLMRLRLHHRGNSHHMDLSDSFENLLLT